MADPVLDDESSIEHNRPIEYYDIVMSNGVTFNICAGNRNLQVGSTLYIVTPVQRTSIDASQVQQRKEVTLTLPIDHPVVARWFLFASPPDQVTVTAWRKQERSQLSEKQWTGLITKVTCDGKFAKLLIPAFTTFTMQRSLPTVSSNPNCVHILYSPNGCKADKTAHQVGPVANIGVNGRDINVDLGDFAKVGNAWSEGGYLVHVPTGQGQTIAHQRDFDPTTITLVKLSLAELIPELKTGDQVIIYAGCAHDVITCFQKFANQANFVGDPYKSYKNPMIPTGLGTIQEA